MIAIRRRAVILTSLGLALSVGPALPAPAQGTSVSQVLDLNPGAAPSTPEQVNVNGTLFFVADDGVHGRELWKTVDGTPQRTSLVADIVPGPEGSSPRFLADVSGTLYFSGPGGLWASDGTPAGTTLVKGGISFLSSITEVGGEPFFFFVGEDAANGAELWRSNGTADGTVLVRDIKPGSPSAAPRELTDAGEGEILFTAEDAPNGNRELWRSDGSTSGTERLADIDPEPAGLGPLVLTRVGDSVFFAASAAGTGEELWRSDGTPGGTVLVSDVNPGSSNSQPRELTNVDGRLFFAAFDPVKRRELFRHDPATGATVLVKDINTQPTQEPPDPPNTTNSFPFGLTDVNGVLFFTADDGVNGNELWRSDGTEAGTFMVKDIHPGQPPEPAEPNDSVGNDLVAGDGLLFFTAVDAGSGRELWQSDGTTAGTVRLTDLRPGPEDGLVNASGRLAYVDTRLFFPADNGATGMELWRAQVPDADGDSLLDRWETEGLDYDLDGGVDLDLAALGASPSHKDLFVEIDYMSGAGHRHRPLDSALADAVKAFAAAPVPNPDGRIGITLHRTVGDAVPEVEDILFGQRGPDPRDDFQDLKDIHFGTAGDRASRIRQKALRQVYRYAIYGHDYQMTGSSGVGEIAGDDFMVTLGSWDSDGLRAGGGRRTVEAGTFVHELGHTLGLRHGGGDDVNHKPNYLSVMSYSFQLGQFWPARPLDYSRGALRTLDEKGGLDEPAGIGGPRDRRTVYGVEDDRVNNRDDNGNRIIDRHVLVERADRALDWNGDGRRNARNVRADPTFLARTVDTSNPLDGTGDRRLEFSEASPDERLEGFDDWANLRFGFRSSSFLSPGAFLTPALAPELDANDVLTPDRVVAGALAVDRKRPSASIRFRRAYKLAAVLRRRLSGTVTAGETGTAAATVELSAATARRLGLRRARVVASGRVSVLAGRRTTLKLRFSGAAKRRLSGGRGIRATLRVRVADRAGNATTLRQRVALRR